MKNIIKNCFSFIMIAVFAVSCSSTDTGRWAFSYDDQTHTVGMSKDGQPVVKGLYASFQLNGKLVTTKEYANSKATAKNVQTAFGQAVEMKVTYSDTNLPTVEQVFYILPQGDYFLTEFSLTAGAGEIQTNYMAPVNAPEMPTIFKTGNNRALFVPFDNDKWVRYKSHTLDFEKLTSYEVTAIYNNESRNGLVIGSVEHDNWKTAIEMTPADKNNLRSITCFGGVADELTRDSKPHGALKGKTVKSPKILVGLFDDWRVGMETFADANATVAPPKAWDKAVPFGWNSWGVLQFSMTYQKVLEVSDFFKNNLQNNNFYNADNTVYVGLDSGWNSFSEEQLTDFVNRCKANGQIAGVYWTPFTDWGKRPDRPIHDAPEYTFKDVYLYANGEPQDLDGAYAIDPTHPAIEAQMKKTSDLFRRCGFEYVKMDFMTHGAMEADKWYKEEIQTGIQAYNYGMELLNKYFGHMFINLSISPIFPAHYAQSRRIACDAWNKIRDTEYTMNAVSYGWWIDRVYQYNDADHIVLRQAEEGENRARVTSAVITGLYIAGDDFSEGGSEEGKERSRKYLTNQAINQIANGVSFRPVEGNGIESEDQFVREGADGFYYVVFNYGEETKTVNVPLARLGLDTAQTYKANELWSGAEVRMNEPLTIPARDVKVLKIK